MSARTLIVRSVALAALLGGGVAFATQSNVGLGSERPQVEPVVLSAAAPHAPRQAPAIPLVADTGGVVMPVGGPVQAAGPTRPDHAQTPLSAPQPQATGFSDLGLPCGLSVASEAMPGAMVALDIMEPCAPNARVEISHAGLVFTARTDALGLLTVDVPALETPAFSCRP